MNLSTFCPLEKKLTEYNTFSLQRDKNKVNKKYENKIQVLTTTIIGEQQQQDGDEIPPPLHRNIILLSKNEIKTIISTPREFKL
jgi:hypothetical protein